ncbi:MAG: UdgX family uracil-DNA binding protein [Jatrophihabitans sp.]|uniref:UdgX family uracil-DNA binding protein n=1 Tax=Jatrophihabitans sp. TaxID=1932789 RepID=UPI003F8129D1
MPPRAKHPGAQGFLPPETTLPELRAAADGCRGCDLWEPATQTVFGAGPADAPLLLVGEQPGDVEDVEGEPFVGPAGRVLAQALHESGLDATPRYVTNAVKHFSFTRQGKRRLHQTPKAAEVSACRPWLVAEYAALRPQLTVCLGSTAVRSVLGTDVKVLRDRGAVLERDSALGPGAFLVTVHPSSILRAPDDLRAEARAAFVADLRVAAQFLG